MNRMTVEEECLIASCDAKDRRGIIQELLQLMPKCDPEMKKVASGAINKLEQINDVELVEIIKEQEENQKWEK